jgi:hypothetical protein
MLRATKLVGCGGGVGEALCAIGKEQPALCRLVKGLGVRVRTVHNPTVSPNHDISDIGRGSANQSDALITLIPNQVQDPFSTTSRFPSASTAHEHPNQPRVIKIAGWWALRGSSVLAIRLVFPVNGMLAPVKSHMGVAITVGTRAVPMPLGGLFQKVKFSVDNGEFLW